MNKILLIDGNSVLHAAAHGTRLMAGDKEVTATFGFLQSLRRLCKKFPDHGPLVLWDSKSNWRYKHFTDYKANRKENPTLAVAKIAVKAQRPDLAVFLAKLGVSQLSAYDFEADDLGGYLASRLAAKAEQIVLVTADRDWMQLVTDKVSWHSPGTRQRPEKTIDGLSFSSTTGYDSTDAFLFAKAMQGDNSDNINGIPGIGAKSALLIANRFKNHNELTDWFNALEGGEIPKGDELRRYNKAVKALVNDKELAAILLRNFVLMDLKNVDIPKDQIRHVVRPYGEEEFKELLREFNFMSILATYDEWVRPIIK